MSILWHSLGGDFPETSEPVVVSWGPGRCDVFTRGWDNHIWHKWYDGGAWGPSAADWADLGGDFPAAARLAAVSWGPGRLDLFGVGHENAIWHKWYEGGAWEPSAARWASLGGENPRRGYYDFDSATRPAVVAWAPGQIDLFVHAHDNTLRHRWLIADQWCPPAPARWEYLRGSFVSNPAAISVRPERIDLFVRTWEGDLWHKWYDGGQWNWMPPSGHQIALYDPWAGWETHPIMRYASSPIAVAACGPQPEAHVFGRGWNNRLIHLWFDTRPHALGWEDLEGDFDGDPAVVSWGPGRFDTFVLGRDQAIWHNWFESHDPPAAEPYYWESLGGPFPATSPPAAVSWGPGHLAVFAFGADRALYHAVYDGGRWRVASSEN